MTSPKKIDLPAFLQDDDAPTIPLICFELGCDNFAQPEDEFCVEHTGKQALDGRTHNADKERTTPETGKG
jgi:hypothetical protein